MQKVCSSLFAFGMAMALTGQGALLVIGGGSEKFTEHSWEREAYQWAVDQSLNRRVAIISFHTQDQALPNFFVEDLAASSAKNVHINSRQIADAPATYDSLMAHDVIFLKGGDQYNYYSTYKGSLTEQALRDKFEEGGVLCGTSAGLAVLGGVDYVAAHASADPGEALANPGNADLTLEDDFLPFMPGVIFDSHFVERGRFGRLLGFMARWQHDRSERLLGVGVDDMTALAIDPEFKGVAYGTGAVNLYRLPDGQRFSEAGGPLAVDSLVVSQLLHGWTYDFASGALEADADELSLPESGEVGNYEILASGGNSLADNEDMLQQMLDACGLPTDRIMVFSRTLSSAADAFISHLEDHGEAEVFRSSVSLSMADDPSLAGDIAGTRKFLFVDLNPAQLSAFLENGQAGRALDRQLRENGSISAFVGKMAGLAGAHMATNYTETGASYAGELAFNEGLGLLGVSMIQPETYADPDVYENTTSCIPYAMIYYGIRYGLWLSPGNFVHYRPEHGKPTLRSYGPSPVMLLTHEATEGGFSTRTSYGDGKDEPRMVAGFDRMLLTVAEAGKPYPLGTEVFPTALNPLETQGIHLYPNPSKDVLHIHCSRTCIPTISDLHGRVRWSGKAHHGRQSIDISHLEAGPYLLLVQSLDGSQAVSGIFHVL